MGQRSLMPGQCPGLPGFGYATDCHHLSLAGTDNTMIAVTMCSNFSVLASHKFQMHYLMRYGRVVAFVRPTLQASTKYTTIDNMSIKFEQSVFIVLLIEHKIT